MESAKTDRFGQVLQLMLAHCPEASTPAVICSLLQARARCKVSSEAHPCLQEVVGLSNFLAWLPKHAGLVSEMQLNRTDVTRMNATDLQVAQHLLCLACTAAATAGAGAGGAAGGAAAKADQLAHPGPQPLELEAFGSNYLASAAVLSALVGTGLRSLHVRVQPALITAGFYQAITSLQSLQKVSFLFSGVTKLQVHNVAASMGSLPNLTSVVCEPFDAESVQCLPTTLTVLCLRGAHNAGAPFLVDLSKFTALGRLGVTMLGGQRTVQVVLPPQLRVLDTCGRVQVQGEHRPSQVTVKITRSADLCVLESLRASPQLNKLSLTLLRSDLADDTCAAVSTLTALTSLAVLGGNPEQAQAAVAAAAPGAPAALWCSYIANLTGLVRLDIRDIQQSSQDLLQLSALTALSRLVLEEVQGLDDLAVVTLACNLTGLEFLHLQTDDVRAAAIVPVAGRLTRLRHLALHLDGTPAVADAITPAVLNQLLLLTQLTCLELPLGPACPEADRQRFVAQMPLLRQIKE